MPKEALSPLKSESAGRAFITGIDGFTGRYLKDELLANGWDVFGSGIGKPEKGEPGTDPDFYRQINLEDIEGLKDFLNHVQPDVIAHLAGMSFIGHGNPNDFYTANLLGTRNLLEAASAVPRKPRNIVLASSAYVYGSTASGTITESHPVDPSSDYAVSKLAMEWMASLWRDRLQILIARPFNYTGLGQSESFLIPKIVSHFKKRASEIELGNLDIWRDLSDVRAVARTYRKLLSCNPPSGTTVNIASGRVHCLREVLDLAQKITHHPILIRLNPGLVRANEVRELCGSTARLTELIGTPDTIPFEETLRWMLTNDT